MSTSTGNGPFAQWIGPALDLLARLYLAGVFLCAAWGKILDPYEFGLVIATYDILPTAAINAVALFLPWLELVAAVFLILGIKTRIQVIAINGMLVVFILAISSVMVRGIEMKGCGCFASAEAEAQISWGYVIRDVVWFAIGGFIFLMEDHRWGLERWLRRRSKVNGTQSGGDKS